MSQHRQNAVITKPINPRVEQVKDWGLVLLVAVGLTYMTLLFFGVA